MKATILTLWLLLFGVWVYAQDMRDEVSLSGEWQMLSTKNASYPAGATGWRTIQIPDLITGKALGGSDFAWFRREIHLPEEWQGRRVFISLVGARYHPRVYVDGKLLGERLEGWTPFEVELTDDVGFGGSHRLEVCCQDWGATFVEGYTLPPDATGDLRGVPRQKVIAPIGGHHLMYGLWDDVELLSRPKHYLDDVAIAPSVRKGTLSISGGGADGIEGYWVEGRVFEADDPVMKTVLQLPDAQISTDRRWQLAANFPDARFWCPEDPHLYYLELKLRREPGGEALDVYRERFGFRELWTEGPDFYFNGVKRHLLASSGWPAPGDQTDEEVRASLEKMRAGNNVAFRLHTQPWQKKWIRIADEVGMMIIEEGALWCDGSGGYAYADERFWNNTREHLAGMVRRDRNHACLVMWSLENEILHCGASRYYPEAEEKLAELGRFVKELDPSHLITYESDLDPGGVADVIGLHYPHEMPQYTDYPNTADWLDRTVKTGTEGDLMGSRGEDFYWDRKKPLYIGEYLWIPYMDYSPGTVFFGDEAYKDHWGFRQKAKALAWMHQTLAYRRAGVSGLCPWTFAGSGGRFSTDDLLYQTQKEVYEPVAAFPREWDSRFYSGETITRTYDVFNDSIIPHELALTWKLGESGSEGGRIFRLSAGEHQPVAVTIELPDVSQRQEVPFNAVLLAEGKEIHKTSGTISIFSRDPVVVPEGVNLLICDPDGSWADTITDLEYKALSSFDMLGGADPARDILVVAPHAFRESETAVKPIVGYRRTEDRSLQAFLAEGGKALILEQDFLQPLSLGLTLVDHPSTMTFRTGGNHPVLEGLTDADLKFWRGDHYVSRKEIARPERSGARTLLVSGGERSLAQGPLVEMTFGRGVVILCQALVGEKYSTEPAARRLFANAISYLAAIEPPAHPETVVISEDDAFVEKLADLGAAFTTLTQPATRGDLDNANLLILHGGGELIQSSSQAIRDFLAESDGEQNVYWHAPEPETFGKLSKSLGVDSFTIDTVSSPVSVKNIRNSVLNGVCREDLTYIGKPVGPRTWYREFEPDPTIIDRSLSPVLASESWSRLEVEDMEMEGIYVHVTESGKEVIFASGGSATCTLNVKEAGYYRFAVMAGGTPAEGVYPRFELSINDVPSNSMTLTDRSMKRYALIAELPQGEVKLKLAFVNDIQTATEDRNLLLDAILVSDKPIPGSELQILTLPPAIAVKQFGNNRLVIDCVRWDTRDLDRGNRYASALLANLEASFAAPRGEPDWLPLSVIEPVGTVPYFRKDDREISLAAAGKVEAEFECLTEGRYTVFIKGHSTPAQGVFAIASVAVDGEKVGEVEVKSHSGCSFRVGELHLTPGKHRVTVAFVNDLYRDGEDRNLYIGGIGFRLEEMEN